MIMHCQWAYLSQPKEGLSNERHITWSSTNMNIFLTIISGVTVFVVGQGLLKLVIDPVQKLKKTIAEVAFSLWNDHAIIHNAKTVTEEQAKETFNRLRTLGSRLAAGYQLIPFYNYTRKLFGLPASRDVSEAGDKLFGLSNNMWGDNPARFYYLDLYRIEICERLGIEDPIKKGLSKQESIDSIKELRG
jgi:hypothetical protein